MCGRIRARESTSFFAFLRAELALHILVRLWFGTCNQPAIHLSSLKYIRSAVLNLHDELQNVSGVRSSLSVPLFVQLFTLVVTLSLSLPGFE